MLGIILSSLAFIIFLVIVAVVDSSASKKEIKLEIDAKVWSRIEAQVKFLRELRIPEMQAIQRPEDLATFYIEQLSLSDNQLEDRNKQISMALSSFSQRGINMRQLLNNFTTSTACSVEDDDEEEFDE